MATKMQPLPKPLVERLVAVTGRNPWIDISLSVNREKPRDEAFGWVMVQLAEENERLRKLVMQTFERSARHPLDHGHMLCRDGGTLVIQGG